MLIRVIDHFRNNPKRIDKLIAIKGLPKEWIFRETPQGLELRVPWMADIEANIPYDIRHLCEPVYVNFRYPPVERGAKEILDRRQIIGIRIDYNSEPGREMWDQVERYLEESIPRNERIPVPVLCAKDERSPFQTYMPRRTPTGSLELIPADVPLVDLTRYVQVIVEERPAPLPTVDLPKPPPVVAEPQKPQSENFKCQDCDFEHRSMAGIRMHRIKRHPKEKVGVK